MERRLLLALGVFALLCLAGCSAAGSLQMQAVTDSELAEGASRSIDPEPTYEGTDRPPWEVVRAAVTNGSTTVTATYPPVERGLPYAVEGAYYNLSRTVVDRQRATIVSIGIDYNATDPNGTAIAYEQLPAPDREALEALLPPKVPPRTDGIDVGAGTVYTDGELNRSVLAPTQQYDVVVFEGERYPIDVDDTRPVTVETYRYEATEVAPNASAYADQLREEYAFTLSNLTDAQQSVVQEAIDSGSYYAESPDDAAFESVVERVRAHEAITRSRTSGKWLVRYRGTLYLVDLRYGAFVEE